MFKKKWHRYMALRSFFILISLYMMSGCTNVFHVNANTHSLPSKEIEPLKPIPAAAIQSLENTLLSSDNVWQRLTQQLRMPIPENKRIQKSRKWYLSHPKHLNAVSLRAEPFMFMIVEEVEKRNLPMELALLPIIESAFDPFAYSHGSASGVWQFTAPTAKYFGLKINWWYDGRRDVPAATTAALDMMEYLYKRMDNNWLYAIAAYNTGEGRVRRAIKRNKKAGKPTDFWSLDLPKETERYVPQLLALADVLKHSDAYGITLHKIQNKEQVELVEIDSQIDLAFAADLADMTLTELHKLNPAFNRWATAPSGPHHLLLPIDKVEQFQENLSQTKPEERLKWVRYKVKSGDSLSNIAEKFNTTSSVIRTVNKMKSNQIIAGKHLLILVSSKDPRAYKMSLEQRTTKRQAKKRGRYKVDYVVQSGDSFWKIAKKYKTSSRSIAHWNHLSPRDTLKVGQRLVLWTNEKKLGNVDTHHTMRKISYRVRQGDSLSRIAYKFKVKINDIKSWNKLSSKKYLKPGQVLRIYVDVTNVSH